MKVFVSSVIQNYGKYREAVRRAVDHVRTTKQIPIEPIMVERDLPSLNLSSQRACLDEVASADIYVLILGRRYGWVNPASGLAATHEEYRTARLLGKPVLAFIQATSMEKEQKLFATEVSDYVTGSFRTTFKTATELRLVTEHALDAFLREKASKDTGTPAAYSQQIYGAGSSSTIIQYVGTLNLGADRKN